jgi:hypothetical protein
MLLQNGIWYITVHYKTVQLQNGNCYETVSVTKLLHVMMGKEDVCPNRM